MSGHIRTYTGRTSRLVEHDPLLDTLLPGDVVLFGPKRTPRKIRGVMYREDDTLHSVSLAILKPSWTKRPYTIYGRHDLKHLVHGRVAEHVSLCTTETECLVQAEVDDRSSRRHILARQMVGLVT